MRANEEIYTLLEQGLQEEHYELTTKGAGGDVSSQLDLVAEAIFIKHLQNFGQIDSEESGIVGTGEAKIIIDPIDGSANALSNLPYYGTSVAKINKEGLLDVAVVCNLANGDLFIKEGQETAKRGTLFQDTFKPLTLHKHSQIGLFEKAHVHAGVVAKLEEQNLKFRSPGAIALSLAYAHEVEFVLFVGRYRLYDFAAGLALCESLEVIVESNYVIVTKYKELVSKLEHCVKDS